MTTLDYPENVNMTLEIVVRVTFNQRNSDCVLSDTKNNNENDATSSSTTFTKDQIFDNILNSDETENIGTASHSNFGSKTDEGGNYIDEMLSDSTMSNNEKEIEEQETDVENENIEDNIKVGKILGDEGKQEESEIEQLRRWAIECKIPHAHLDKLLEIFRARLLPNLPKSSKTFLNTSSANYKIEAMIDNDDSIGEFVYFGIRRGLQTCIDPAVYDANTIYLQINIDGMPLFKSSSKVFWPILCRVHFNPMIYKPFPIAIYAGNSKPKILTDFLKQFIIEINELQAEGLVIREKHFLIKLKCFICDTPARSYIKCTQGHVGLNSCERCEVRGEKVNKVTVFLSSTSSQERTDSSFRNFNQPSHHTKASPLLLINPPINMVTDFILDYMHLCCLRVMKRLLECWTSTNMKVKLSQQQRAEVSRRLEYLKPHIPSSFSGNLEG